jgi:hypothetical protein
MNLDQLNGIYSRVLEILILGVLSYSSNYKYILRSLNILHHNCKIMLVKKKRFGCLIPNSLSYYNNMMIILMMNER